MITIIKYKNQYSSAIGAFKYHHIIQYKIDGYKYDLDMTDEGMIYLISILKKSGNDVKFIDK